MMSSLEMRYRPPHRSAEGIATIYHYEREDFWYIGDSLSPDLNRYFCMGFRETTGGHFTPIINRLGITYYSGDPTQA